MRPSAALPKNDLNLTFEDLALSNKARVYTFMGGPRFFKKTGRVVPFAQMLAGVAHMRLESTFADVPEIGTFSEEATDFAIQPGGGVTIFLSERVGVRLAADYRCIMDFEDDNTYANEFRFVSGFTFNWGARNVHCPLVRGGRPKGRSRFLLVHASSPSRYRMRLWTSVLIE